MKYLKEFNNDSEYESFKNSAEYVEPNVSFVKNTPVVKFNRKVPQYLTFTAEEANSTIQLNRIGTLTTLTNASLQYSTDNGETWNDYILGNAITLANVGDSIKFKGTNTTLGVNTSNCHNFVMTGKIAAKGDITSLFNEIGGDMAMSSYGCCRLFQGCTSLTSAPKLPATTLAEGCYTIMFQRCTSLTSAPKLPATTLTEGCYSFMFQGCTSLTTAPELPAITLAQSCYQDMFSDCRSLTTAPELPATTLTQFCYSEMFWNCTSLTSAPELSATTLAINCYMGMFQRCTSLTSAPKLPATTLPTYCYNSMFQGCTSLTTAPELPATTLTEGCYASMFYGCTSLTTAPELPAITLAGRCYQQMFQGCTSLTTAPELPAINLKFYCYSNMFNGCSNLSYIKAMFTTTPSSTPSTSYTNNWVSGVKSTGTFIKNSAATWTTTGVNGVPSGWTVQTAAA